MISGLAKGMPLRSADFRFLNVFGRFFYVCFSFLSLMANTQLDQ